MRTHENPHLHVYTTKSYNQKPGKIWIETTEFAYSGDLSKSDCALIKKLVRKNSDKLLDQWNRYKNDETIKPINLSL